MQEPHTYPAKVDAWLWLVLAGSSVGLIAWGGWVWTSDPTGALFLIGVGLFNTILFAVLLFPCHYTLGEYEVLIRCGILRYRIPIDQVRSVNPSWSPWSAPAPSLKRVAIRLDNGRIHLVSPKDRDGFIRELRNRATARRPATPLVMGGETES